jgi:glucokinase
MTREAMEAHPESLLHAAAQRSGSRGRPHGFPGRRAGGPCRPGAVRALCAAYVAAGVVDLLNILHPEVLALGGGVAAAPEELLLEPVRRIAERESFGRHCGRITRIVRAELGNDAGIIGAAMLCRVR